ncbi:MAG: aldo/keto reductase [Clostridiales bacterium]|nr:aldo/keto reductase [Clostridiales bacterium]
MENLRSTYRLNNSVQIPKMGFGTWQLSDGDEAYNAVLSAIRAGYRHIDTAAMYGNEKSVGAAIKDSGVDRESLFITSKLPNSAHGYLPAREAFIESLKNLGLQYLDMYLIHWPNPMRNRSNWKQANRDSWKALEELFYNGKIRAIGVSNFRAHHLDALFESAVVIPAVNQIRLCPGDEDTKTVRYCRDQNILLEAYSPLGSGLALEVPLIQQLAKAYKKSPSQICLRWSLQNGYLPLPKTTSPERMAENADVFDFELVGPDMLDIAELKDCSGHAGDPDKVEW